MALITYDDKQAMGTQPTIPDVNKITDSDMNQIKNVINNMEPTFCLATITTSPTISSNYLVTLNSIDGKNGDFTLQDGGIRIGTGINVIKVSGNIFIDEFPMGSSYVWGKIIRVRNNVQYVVNTSINGSNCSFLSTPIPTSLITVQEGDIIKLMADGSGGGKIRGYTANTWLFIEKVA